MPAPDNVAKAVQDPPDPQRVLVVEDEQKVANALREGLESEGYEVVLEQTGEA